MFSMKPNMDDTSMESVVKELLEIQQIYSQN
jgi:hypothetical protein